MSEKKRSKARLWVLLGLAALLAIFSALAPALAPNDPYATSAAHMNEPPCARYPLGADRYGRCVLSRVLMGARTSIASALALVGAMLIFGGALGMLCGERGGALDEIVMRVADVFLAFPQMVLAVAVAGMLGGSLRNAMIAVAAGGWPTYARLARSQVLALRREPYILAARLSGCGRAKVLFCHMLPNMLGSMLVYAASQLGVTMMAVAGLSFLGVGVTPPAAEWGSMIAESRAYIQLAPWAVLAPAGAMVLCVMIFNLLGDALRDVLELSPS